MLDIKSHLTKQSVIGIYAIAAALLAHATAFAGLQENMRVVIQKGRNYTPTDLFLRRGDNITVINEDAHLIHHAFIEADQFAFDAGDQEPGSTVVLKLNKPGNFILQCGIHPKMKLTIHVQ